MKDCCISKLTITKTGHQATQFKKIVDDRPILCVDKNYRYIDDIVCTRIDLREAAFLLAYPDPALWLDNYNVEIKPADPTVVPETNFSEYPIIILLVQKTHVFNANLQK